MSEAAARLRGQIYEAEYSMRFINHDDYCAGVMGSEKDCGRLSGMMGRREKVRGYCARWKQLRRIETLKQSLADLLAKERKQK